MSSCTSTSHEWVWDENETTAATFLNNKNQEVWFHPSYSSGTAAVRGSSVFLPGRDYFWELEMLTPLYGTDIMVGVGTAKVDLKKYQYQFSSLLGADEESWGYSYSGLLHHNGVLRHYGLGFSQGNKVGVHLDTWKGTLTFYINRKPLGVAFTSLNSRLLYPMVCSTAARSAMRIVCAHSFPSSLQLLCLKTLGLKSDLMREIAYIPGLRVCAEQAFWTSFPPGPTRKGKELPWCYNRDTDSNAEDDNSDVVRQILLSQENGAGGALFYNLEDPNRLESDDLEIYRNAANIELFLDNNLYVDMRGIDD